MRRSGYTEAIVREGEVVSSDGRRLYERTMQAAIMEAGVEMGQAAKLCSR